jgi:transcriptional regulator with XRE-family HTH domain
MAPDEPFDDLPVDEDDLYDLTLQATYDPEALDAIHDQARDDLAEEQRRWLRVAEMLGSARRRRKLSKRAAARAAGFSEGLWRHLEEGVRLVYGQEVTPNPRDENLVGAATAVGIDPAELFAAVGRTWDPTKTPVPESQQPAGSRSYREASEVELTPEERVELANFLASQKEAFIAGVRARRPVTGDE